MKKSPILTIASMILVLTVLSTAPKTSFQALYYSPQTNFEEHQMPLASYSWDKENIEGCIFKEDGVSNSHYVWAKLAVQFWRQALKEYTEQTNVWNITARYGGSTEQAEDERCDFAIYIHDLYSDFPEYPNQKGAYTSAEFTDGIITSVDVYLAPVVLHGDGKTEIELPSYAFRNSAVHEVGHLLGLSHMQSPKGYLMSPQFDYFEENDRLPITTLELSALEEKYGDDGFD